MNDELETRKQLAKNTLFSGLTSVSDVFLLLLLILAARLLGPENYGIFSFALASTSILVFSLNLGLDSLVIRKIAINRKNAQQIIANTLAWKILVSAILLFAFTLIAYLITSDPITQSLLLILAPAAVLRSINMTLRSYIQAFERFKLESTIVLCERLTLFVIGSMALWGISDPIILAWLFLLIRLGSASAYILLINKFICRFSLHLNIGFVKRFQIEAWPLGVAAMIFGVYTQIDTIMLGMLRPASDVGLFSAPQKIYEGCFVIALIINSVTYPRLSALYLANPFKHRDLIFRTFKYLFILAMPLMLIGMFFSQEIILLLFGEDYIKASNTLVILLIAISLYFLVASMFNAFRSMGMQKTVMYISLAGLVLKIISNYLLIPDYGHKGAAVAVCFSTMVMLASAFVLLAKQEINLAYMALPMARIIGSALISALCVSLLSDIPFMINIPIMFGVYVLFLFVLRCFDQYEIELMKHAVINLNRA